MEGININARIKRNKLIELAGKHYRDENSEIVETLRSQGEKPLLGIQRDTGMYTILGESSTYYLTDTGIKGEISHKKFLEILKKNAFEIGKTQLSEFVKISKQESIWVLNGPTMCAIWNTIMLLNKDEG